jgi:hypothetical protein
MFISRSLTTIVLSLVFSPVFAVSQITCISENNAFSRCGLPDADHRHVSLSQVISGDCNGSGAWGVDSAGVWVRNNCAATFQYTGGDAYNYNQPVEPYIYGYDYGPDYYYPGSAVFFGSGYYHHNNYYHNNGYHGYHGNGNYPRP